MYVSGRSEGTARRARDKNMSSTSASTVLGTIQKTVAVAPQDATLGDAGADAISLPISDGGVARLSLSASIEHIRTHFGHGSFMFKGERQANRQAPISAVKKTSPDVKTRLTFREKWLELYGLREALPASQDVSAITTPLLIKFQPVYECTERHFLTELRILKRLEELAPGLAPRVHAAWIIDGSERGVLVMERLDGCMTLREWCRTHVLAAQNVQDLVATVQRVHAAGIVHGDLHQDNVLVEQGAPPRFRLLDFGDAQEVGSGSVSTWSDFDALLRDMDVMNGQRGLARSV